MPYAIADSCINNLLNIRCICRRYCTDRDSTVHVDYEFEFEFENDNLA